MPILILACGHCGVPESVAKLPVPPDAASIYVRDLCDHSAEILRDQAGPSADVIFLAGADPDGQAVLLEDAVAAGVHPLRVRFLDAWRLSPSSDSITAHLRAAIIRIRARDNVEAFSSRATNRFRGTLPRRSLLIPFARYRAPLPRIDPSRCRSSTGCDLCVQRCPMEAIGKGTPPHIDPEMCTSCGLCLASCPVAAISHPSMDFPDLEAEALAEGPHRNLLVACSPVLATLTPQDLASSDTGWRILEVPSLAALRPVEVLRLLSIGFDRVVALGRGDCCPGAPGPFATVAAFLGAVGYPSAVTHWDLRDGPLPRDVRPAPRSLAPSLRAFDSLTQAASALAATTTEVITLPGPGAGLVSIEARDCTFCGLCAERCWSKALSIDESPSGALALRFDHARCDGCELCAQVCPEQAVTVRFAIDPCALDGVSILAEDTWVTCRSCGARVAPRAMIHRVAMQLKAPASIDLCPDCKILTAMGS